MPANRHGSGMSRHAAKRLLKDLSAWFSLQPRSIWNLALLFFFFWKAH
jgi:hypothetical protein